ncbi:MAG: M18 family aminopeptidase [Spirochaetales bacterium]|nr:M18 family aminopeptidase [Spirochaetales bacterium]
MEKFLKNSITAWHGVDELKNRLIDAGFILLKEEESWNLEAGKGYFLSKNGRSLAAFRVGSAPVPRFNIIAAHTDSPHLRLKKESLKRDGSFLTGRVSVYGGPILSTWFDRPLGLAGSVILSTPNGTRERQLFDSKEAIGIIPNAAIHLNREVNKGYEIKPSKHLPVMLTLEEDLEDYLAGKLSVTKEAILSCQLEFYLPEAPKVYGSGENQLLSSPRIDNLVHCLPATEALIESEPGESTPLCLFFDSEEIGSRTIEGAQSALTDHLMERICLARSIGREEQLRARALSFILSADVAHGWNPNFGEKYDDAYKCHLNGGPAVKIDMNSKYATTSETEARIKQLAQARNIPLQTYIHHSDLPCGSTVGPLLSSDTAIACLDLGIPLWAMHSACETAGMRDIEFTKELFLAFFRNEEA